MNLCKTKTQYHNGLINKADYIMQMYQYHQQLFEYANFIPNTDIAKIEIQDQLVIMTTRTSGIKIICNFPDSRATPLEILNFSFYEKEDAELIFQLIKPGFTVFDIGANIGWYSLNMAHKFTDLQLYAFEPIPYTFDLLEKNIALNNLSTIKCFNLGFSNQENQITFYLNGTLLGNASVKNVSENPQAQKVLATVTTLDLFVDKNNIKALDFIKCDVEGAELLVFQGGLNSLQKFQPIIFCEMLRKWSVKFDYHPNDIIKLFTNLGYRCFHTQKGKLIEFFTMDENTVATNFFFLHTNKHQTQITQLTKI